MSPLAAAALPDLLASFNKPAPNNKPAELQPDPAEATMLNAAESPPTGEPTGPLTEASEQDEGNGEPTEPAGVPQCMPQCV